MGLVVSVVVGACAARLPVGPPPERAPWPNDAWTRASPEAVGLNSAALADAVDAVQDRGLHIDGIFFVRHGYEILNATYPPYGGQLHDVASVTKSVTSTLIGIAIDRGEIPSVDTPVLSFFEDESPAPLDERWRALTLAHLLSMTTGLDCGYRPGEAEIFEMRRRDDWTRAILALPMRTKPGVEFRYCSPGMHLLSIIISRATGMSALAYARAHLFDPLGIDEAYWPEDPQGHNHGWGDLQLRPADMAKIGHLFLNDGEWSGRAVVSRAWVRRATTRLVENTPDPDSGYGYGWWVLKGDFDGVYEARGRGGQAITVWPRRRIVVAWTGRGREDRVQLAPLLVRAVVTDGSLPEKEHGRARLEDALRGIEETPEATTVPPIPALGRKISGRRFVVQDNRLELSGLRFEFAEDGAPEASCTLWLGDDPWDLRIGLDGIARFAPGPRQIEVGAVGGWVDDGRFRMRFDEVAGPEHYELTLVFRDQFHAMLEMKDPSGYQPVFDLQVTAPASP